MAKVSPRGAIVGAWNLLEEGTIAAAMAKGISFPEHLPNYQIMSLLVERGYVGQEVVIYNRLRRIRNEAVHSSSDRDIDDDLAKRFVDLAWPMYERLMQLAHSSDSA